MALDVTLYSALAAAQSKLPFPDCPIFDIVVF